MKHIDTDLGKRMSHLEAYKGITMRVTEHVMRGEEAAILDIFCWNYSMLSQLQLCKPSEQLTRPKFLKYAFIKQHLPCFPGNNAMFPRTANCDMSKVRLRLPPHWLTGFYGDTHAVEIAIKYHKRSLSPWLASGDYRPLDRADSCNTVR